MMIFHATINVNDAKEKMSERGGVQQKSIIKIKNKHNYTIGGITNLTWYFVTKTSVHIGEIFENTKTVCDKARRRTVLGYVETQELK